MRVDLEFIVPTDRTDSTHQRLPVTVRFHYVEPGRQVQYTVASLSKDIPSLIGEVTAIRYYDVQRRRLHFAHGSAKFEWLGDFLANRRKVFYGEEGYAEDARYGDDEA